MSVNILNRILPQGPMQGPMVWTRPKSTSENFVVLSATELIVGTQWSWKIRETAESVASGKSVSEILGKNATYIPLFAVSIIEAVVGRADFRVTFDKGSGRQIAHNVAFASPQLRDEALDALKVRLGPHVDCERRQLTRFAACLFPLLAFVVLAIAAASYYHLTAAVFEITAVSPAVKPAAMQAWHADPTGRLTETSPLASLGVAGLFAGALTAMLLGILGYTASSVLLLTGTGLSFCMSVYRFVSPPISITFRAHAAT